MGRFAIEFCFRFYFIGKQNIAFPSCLYPNICYNTFMKKLIFLILIQILFLTSCNAKETKLKETSPKEVTVNTFKSVSMEEGLKLMASDKDFILLDVRTPEEYAGGHIPGALQLTNETFTKQDAENLLKNKAQTIYVYCRSGRRSKQSSQKLVDFGYTNVIEIGGILDYSGVVEK